MRWEKEAAEKNTPKAEAFHLQNESERELHQAGAAVGADCGANSYAKDTESFPPPLAGNAVCLSWCSEHWPHWGR